MTERALATAVMAALKPLDAMRVENPALPGTPDVNICLGKGREAWIELKQIDAWPARAYTPLRVPHFTPQQKVWLQRRIYKGGVAYVLIQVAADYLLLEGTAAAKMLGQATREGLLEIALAHWVGKPQLNEELRECLLRLAN